MATESIKEEIMNPGEILIALDKGYGHLTPGKRTPILPAELQKGRTLNYMPEHEFNKAVVLKLDKKLRDIGFKTIIVSPTDTDTPLKARTDLANNKKARVFVSVHANAHLSKWGDANGIETYHYPNSSGGKKLAQIIHKYLIQGTKQRDRGVKSANFHVLRATLMPSVLIEAGFMDNLVEAKLLLSNDYRDEVATEITKGLCEYFNIPYKGASTPTQPITPNKPEAPHKCDNEALLDELRLAKKKLSEIKGIIKE